MLPQDGIVAVYTAAQDDFCQEERLEREGLRPEIPIQKFADAQAGIKEADTKKGIPADQHGTRHLPLRGFGRADKRISRPRVNIGADKLLRKTEDHVYLGVF